MQTVCPRCGRDEQELYLVGRAWLCIWCVDPMSFPTLRQRARMLRLRAQAMVEEIRERRGQGK